jgi:hypothetical protein
MKNKLIFDKSFNVRETEHFAPFGTLVCYDGCAIAFDIVKEKDGVKYILCEDFPFLSFCGNIIEGTEQPEKVVKFLTSHGEEISIDEIKELINDFKKIV